MAAQITPQFAPIVPPALVFGVVFVLLRLAFWYLAERLDVSPMPAQVERPEFLLSLPLVPIGFRVYYTPGYPPLAPEDLRVNASEWLDHAAAFGYPVGRTPRAGAIIEQFR